MALPVHLAVAVPEPATTRARALDILRTRFGHMRFRPDQERAIDAVLAGEDVLAVLPTAAGKSVTYQVPSQLLPGLTIVISPLLALIKDQLDSLAALGISAGAIHSLQSKRQARDVLEDVVRGATKLLYVTPERFEDSDFTAGMQSAGVSLFVVDEAHCISEWGHSFRPAYLALPDAVDRLGRPPVLALTATATRWIQQDIVEQLRMRNPRLIVSGTDRPNLYFEVVRVEEERQDKTVLHNLLVEREESTAPDDVRDATSGSGIIYCATTRSAQQTARWLREWGITAAHYHGRLKKSERERVQVDFMEGELRVIVATNAFGLGVDKPDIRFVIHRDIPASLEAYYQEAGRAGRDGEAARCTLIYRPGDLGLAAFLGSAAESEDQRRRAFERSRVEMMRGYAELRDCRRRYILNYFGEDPDWERCDWCDVDLAHGPSGFPPSDQRASEFAINDRVVHVTLGPGVVQRIAADTVTVLFEESGYRTLSLDLVREQRLLHLRLGDAGRTPVTSCGVPPSPS